MALSVHSEIGRLRRVLVHRPGLEIDHMVPSMMEHLLFDDILYGSQARAEHDVFRGVLAAAGVETFDPQDLLADVLAGDEVRDALLAALALDAGTEELLAAMAPAEIAAALIGGVVADEPRGDRGAAGFYRLPPVSNYFFQRDPQAVLGRRVLVSSMATAARRREPLLSRACFAHHPALATDEAAIRLADAADDGSRTPYIEGGDVLVASPEVLLVGLSERTNRRGIEALAQQLRRDGSRFRQLIVVELPPRRSYMHLDTVFTFIDHGLCLAFPPVISPGGAETGDVYRVDLGARELSYIVEDDLPNALAGVGIDVELVPCGGDRLIDQQREQWTDGANAFALEPGVIVTYRRNRRTADELSRRGWRVVGQEEVLDGGVALLGQGPTVVTLRANELSRARGGPRCMTMPLERDPLA